LGLLDKLGRWREQRRHPRHGIISTAWIRIADDPVPHVCVLWDISEGGAWIRCAPQLHVGETATLRINGFAPALPFIVRDHDGEAAHVAFTLGGELKQQLGLWVTRNFHNAAAA